MGGGKRRLRGAGIVKLGLLTGGPRWAFIWKTSSVHMPGYSLFPPVVLFLAVPGLGGRGPCYAVRGFANCNVTPVPSPVQPSHPDSCL